MSCSPSFRGKEAADILQSFFLPSLGAEVGGGAAPWEEGADTWDRAQKMTLGSRVTVVRAK